ncbi:hypothetical protein ACFQ60_23285 [Streptomyces zhihengii]
MLGELEVTHRGERRLAGREFRTQGLLGLLSATVAAAAWSGRSRQPPPVI